MTPKHLGYHFPAEWAKHRATWLSFPHNENSWPGKIEQIYPSYFEFIRLLAESEEVHLNVQDEAMANWVRITLKEQGAKLENVFCHLHPTNDAWCRDHGPAFLINHSEKKRAIVNWHYNAWGEKYPPYDLDNQISSRIATLLNLPQFTPNIIMEGGAVEFNGKGTVLTSKACLLNPNRNPKLNQEQIEQYLCEYYGVNQVLWVNDGIVGDDTDGHIDDMTRFVNEDTVVTALEPKHQDENHDILQENLELLKKMKLPNGQRLNIVPLPMPEPVVYEGQRLPASYANFYIANKVVIVPTYRCQADEEALRILEECFKGRKVIGIDSTDLIWGLGSFHCLSQQEPDIL